MKSSIVLRQLTYVVFLTSVLVACGTKKDSNPQELIAGTDSKVWVAKKQLDASGDKDKMTSEEKDQRMTFYRNGKFSIQADADQQTGTWSYDAASKSLALEFENATMREVFAVESLESNEMKVKASDGTVMIMKQD